MEIKELSPRFPKTLQFQQELDLSLVLKVTIFSQKVAPLTDAAAPLYSQPHPSLLSLAAALLASL